MSLPGQKSSQNSSSTFRDYTSEAKVISEFFFPFLELHFRQITHLRIQLPLSGITFPGNCSSQNSASPFRDYISGKLLIPEFFFPFLRLHSRKKVIPEFNFHIWRCHISSQKQDLVIRLSARHAVDVFIPSAHGSTSAHGSLLHAKSSRRSFEHRELLIFLQ